MDSAAKQRVLVVDDEPQVLVALEDLLGDEYLIYKSDSAHRALELMEHERDIAVVITDQRMPRMTGDQMLAKMPKSSHALSIMVTGFADLGAVINAVNDGKIFAYVTKPWNPDDLRQKVHQAADHFRLAQELARERQLLHDLMDNTPDGIYFKDRELRFLRANTAFARTLSSASPDSLVGKRLADLVGNDALSHSSDAADLSVLNDNRPALDVVRGLSLPDGQHWFSETRAPIRTPDGEVIGLVGISHDVTERMATLQALRESEDRFRKQTQILNSVLEGMGEGVVVLDRDGKVVIFNRSARVSLGEAPEGLPPSEWAKHFGLFRMDRETPLPLEENPLFRQLAAGEHAELELFVRNERVAGSVLAVTATSLIGADTNVERIAVLRDVTRQRLLEAQLAQSQKMEAIGLLAGGVAHDFNNLLAVIKSAAELALREAPEIGSQREDLEEVLAASDRASSLTRQLLAFSRRQLTRPQRLNLNEVVSNLERMLRRIIGEHIELSAELAPDLGSALLDAGQLEQIIVNLTVNARDAMPDGGTLTLRTSNVELDGNYIELHASVAPGSYVELTVSDTGTGMDEATRRHIFEPFFTTKEIGKGTGLGLATVYGIVQQHNGHIWVYSEVGSGTCFKLYFPRLAAKAETVTAPRSERPLPSGSATILLVEDDDAVRRIASKILREYGYTVFAARRPKEAREIMASRSHVDLLLTDVVIPETVGPKLAQELCKAYPGLRVLYISGYPGAAVARQSLVSPNEAYLEKPFSPQSLLEKVQETLREAPKVVL